MSVAQGGVSGLLAGRYAIERELGQGATATVHLARDTRAGMSVAVKLLRPELAESNAAKRFLKEIRRTASLDHPRILKVLDAGEHDGRPFFVLPYMEGGTLRQRLKREPQLPLDEAIAIARSIAEALDYAHERGLIHQDVKPENILFTGGVACLGDFGIAHALEAVYGEASSTTHVIRGTPAYMSPEQAAGEMNLDGRSDQYSLACVFYEMVTGMPAFMGPTPESVIAQRFAHPPRHLQVYRRSAPAALDAALGRGLSVQAADRYPSAVGLVQAMEEAIGSTSVAATTLRRAPRLRIAFTSVATLIVAFGLFLGARWIGGADPPLDESRLLIMPFRTSDGLIGEDLLHQAIRRWRGVAPVSMAEVATRSRSAAASDPTAAAALATSFGAKRFLLTRPMRTPVGPSLAMEYHDVTTGLLHALQVPLPADTTELFEVLGAAMESVLLQGRTDGAPSRRGAPVRHVAATALVIRAFDARDQWRLTEADSLLRLAMSLDPDYSRAYLWWAQVRSWQGLPGNNWVTAAERAAGDTLSLTSAERHMAQGLVALGTRAFVRACAEYDSLAILDPRSFVAWYGKGECRRRDNVVLPYAGAASGYRYRASFEHMIRSYTRAFELLPASYHGFQDGSFSQLRALLFTSPRQLRNGYREGSQHPEFLGRPRLAGDTLVLVPYRQELVASAHPAAAASPEAVQRLRSIFHTIVARWAGAYPQSAATKEGVAISLQLQAAPASADSMRAAARLADAGKRIELESAAIIMQALFALPHDISALRMAVRAADVLLRQHPNALGSQAAALASVAALLGRCAQTAELLRRAASPLEFSDNRVPADAIADAHALQAYVSLGCPMPPGTPTPRQLADRLLSATASAEVRSIIEGSLIGPAVGAMYPLDTHWVRRLAPRGDYLFAAQLQYIIGKQDSAAAILRRVGQTRMATLGQAEPETAVPEAELWLLMGERAAATTSLRTSLEQLRNAEPYVPEDAASNVVRIAAIGRAMLSLGRLVAATDPDAAQRWRLAAVTLWGPDAYARFEGRPW